MAVCEFGHLNLSLHLATAGAARLEFSHCLSIELSVLALLRDFVKNSKPPCLNRVIGVRATHPVNMTLVTHALLLVDRAVQLLLGVCHTPQVAVVGLPLRLETELSVPVQQLGKSRVAFLQLTLFVQLSLRKVIGVGETLGVDIDRTRSQTNPSSRRAVQRC